MNLTAYISLIMAVAFGAAIGMYLDRFKSKQYLSIILPFSGAFLLGVAVLHMLPQIFYQSDGDHSLGIYILLGFLIQIILEFLSKGVEHGHVHAKKGQNKGYLTTIMFGLCAHAFLEGLPINNLSESHLNHAHSLFDQPYLWGIVAHKLPAATALSLLLLASNVKKRTMFLLLLIFAIMSPLGSFLASIISMSEAVQKIVFAIAIGSILHIATIIIFETDESSHHQVSYKKILAVLSGFGMSLLSLI